MWVKNRVKKLLEPDIISLLSQIHEQKGKQGQYLLTNADDLVFLTDVAKVQSVASSNRIEGIMTANERYDSIVLERKSPKGRSEQDIAGYRDVLNVINESYAYIEPKPSVILQLHRQLLSFSGIGGNYKISDNHIEETDSEGRKTVRFRTATGE